MNNIKGLSDKKRAEIVAMAELIYKSGFRDGQASTVEDTAGILPLTPASEGIIHDGKLLRKVDREACNGDYIRPNKTLNGSALKDGIIYGPVEHMAINQYNVYQEYHNRTKSNVEVFEVVSQEVDMPEPLTANQQRAKVIQRAREFVEQTIYERRELVGLSGKEISYDYRFWDLDFVVNAEKRTVVALLIDRHTKRVRIRGIAKSMPGDVFNEWIGKAIALARALEIDIPQEFLDAVQPDFYVVGHIITFPKSDGPEWHMSKCYRVDTVEVRRSKLTKLFGDGSASDGGNLMTSQFDESEHYKTLPIIDDTNAEYGQVR